MYFSLFPKQLCSNLCAVYFPIFPYTDWALAEIANGLRIEMLLCARGKIYSDSVTLIVTTMVVLALVFLSYRLFTERIERRIWNVE